VTTLARYEVDPGTVDTVLELLATAARATSAETGNLYFHAFRDADDAIVLVEGWDSAESLETHRRTDHFNSIVLGEIAPKLTSRHVEVLRPAFDGEFG
jgi:(4S)-4-hydroxy-5-phosphonooxypentane-2,3-dione isomerase